MADNINLIPAAELPTTEADEVDVLCVENGEIKRKPAANLSGGGGGGYVIKATAEEFGQAGEPGEDGSMTIALATSYDDFIDILLAGGSVWIDFTEAFSSMGLNASLAAAITSWMWTFLTDGTALVSRVALVMPNGSGIVTMPVNVLFPNGTWTPGE